MVRRLQRARGRTTEAAFVVEGEDLVLAGIDAGYIPRYVLLDADRGSEVRAQVYAALHRTSAVAPDDVPVLDVEPELLAGVVELAHPPRAVAVFPTIPMPDVAAVLAAPPGTSPCIYLDAVADPGNVGTILRSAAALGAAVVICGPGTSDPFNPKAIRASMGGVFAVPVMTGVSADQLIAAAADRLVALDGAATTSIDETARRMGAASVLIVGSERAGVCEQLRASAQLASIPQKPGMESLNAGVAAAIALYEWSRA